MERKPTLVVALGGNALLKRGEPLEAEIQRQNIELAARTIAGHRGPLLAAPSAWLIEHRVNPWMGERSLPLWLGGDHALWGFQDHRNDRAVTSGLRLRPMVDTLTDTLAWESARGEPRTAGLDDADHDELVQALSADIETRP